ncbi:hypothetical protein, conserved [Eimeria praecox]|uniref:Pre-mRNA-splicing factor cwc2 n=1 Tax=Eimeria praecox TaxID=51316 RepID=U6GQ30_9EIME|nr:hypothetical protein, conserved [Eimeria praecox]
MMEGGKPVESSGESNSEQPVSSDPPPPVTSAPCPDPLPSASTVDSPVRTEEVSASAGLQEEPPSTGSEGWPPSSVSGQATQPPVSGSGCAESYAEFYAQYAAQLATYSSQRGQNNGQGGEELPHLCDSKRELVQQWLTRPARRQVEETEAENSSHLEGQNEYNIWYGRHLTDRHSRTGHQDRDAALHRCDPELDSGYTLADTQPGGSEGYFCAFFAKGCCSKGSECRYKHRIPILEDEYTLDWSRDIFGRERHRDHRDDMGGAGSFNHECKTLFVSGLQVDPKEEDGLRSVENFLWRSFGVWGDLVSVRVIPKKLIGFVTYAYRVQAEFAKVAMADQNFGKYGSLLTVKWAHQDNNAKHASKGPEEAVLNGSARRRRSIIAEAIPEENSVESQHQINRAEQSLKIIQKKKNLNSYRSKDRRESERNDEASDDRSSDDYYSVAVERQRASSRAAAAAPGAAAVHGSSSNNNSNSNSNSNSNRRSSRHSLRKQASSKEKLKKMKIRKEKKPYHGLQH